MAATTSLSEHNESVKIKERGSGRELLRREGTGRSVDASRFCARISRRGKTGASRARDRPSGFSRFLLRRFIREEKPTRSECIYQKVALASDPPDPENERATSGGFGVL